jgi:hypothetical protein
MDIKERIYIKSLYYILQRKQKQQQNARISVCLPLLWSRRMSILIYRMCYTCVQEVLQVNFSRVGRYTTLHDEED